MPFRSNVAAVLAHLNLPQYDVVRDMIRARFAAQVKSSVDAWFAAVIAHVVTPRPHPSRGHNFPEPGMAGLYLDMPKRVNTAGYYERDAAIVDAVNAGEYHIDADKVREHADREWQQTKEFYAGRVGGKIDALLEGEARIECRLSLNGFLVGLVAANLGSKALVLATNLKTNYRYGVFAADRRETVYRQVPTIVQSYSGFDLPAREAQIARESAAAKDERRGSMEAIQKEIGGLERQKRSWDEIYTTHRFAQHYDRDAELQLHHVDRIRSEMDKLGMPKGGDVVTCEVAWAKVKELRASIKDAKERLRVARKPVMESSA